MRSAKVIKWFYINNAFNNRIVYGFYNKGKLEAYYIFICNFENVNKLICYDIWSENLTTDILKSFVVYAINETNNNNIDVIIFPEFNNHLKKLFNGLGFINKKVEDKRLFKYSSEESPGLQKLEETYFTNFLVNTEM